MTIQTKTINGVPVAVITGAENLMHSPQAALDMMMTVQYETGCSRIAVAKEAVADDFFVLSTRLAGEVLQKFVNYHVKLAVFGDFSAYTSKPLKDFIYESNKGRNVFFVATENEALERLSDV